MDIPEITDARRLELRPGDVLAIRLDHFASDEELDCLKAHLAVGLPGIPVLFLDPGTDIAVIKAPAPDGA